MDTQPIFSGRLVFSALLLLVALSGLAQNPPTDALLIQGPSGKAATLKFADLAAMPQATFRVKDRDRTVHEYSGVSLATLLIQAQAPLGSELKGKALAQYLLVEASDGYQVVFALPELDAAFTRQVIFLATKRDGQPLPAGQGPFRIVVPQETKQARWVRQVTALRVITAAK